MKFILQQEAVLKSRNLNLSMENLNMLSDSNVVMLRVTNEEIVIGHISPNCLELFEVLNKEDLIGKSINEFLPKVVARIHDQLLVQYLEQNPRSMFSNKSFRSFMITKQLNLKEVSIHRIVDFRTKDYLYVSAVIKVIE